MKKFKGFLMKKKSYYMLSSSALFLARKRKLFFLLLSLTIYLVQTPLVFARISYTNPSDKLESNSPYRIGNETDILRPDQFRLKVEQEIHNQAEEFYYQFKKIYPDNPVTHTYWMKLWKSATASLKVLSKKKEIIHNYGGSQIASITVATEIVSSFILPPILTLLGLPVLAGLSAGIPWGVVAGAGVFSWKMMKFRLKLLKELKVSSLSKLDKIREDIIGYEIKFHVTTMIYNQLQNEFQNKYEFNIIERWKKEKQTNTPYAENTVSVEELEEIVKKSGNLGANFVGDLKSDVVNLSLYATKLIKFIENDNQLREQFKSLLDSRINLVSKALQKDNTSDLMAKNLLLRSNEFQQILNLKIDLLREIELKIKSYKKKKLLEKTDAEKIFSHISQSVDAIVALKNEVTRIEYHYLLDRDSQIFLDLFENISGEFLEKYLKERLTYLEYSIENLKVREEEMEKAKTTENKENKPKLISGFREGLNALFQDNESSKQNANKIRCNAVFSM